MAKRTFKAGATDQTVDVFISDSSSTTGAGLAGLVYNSASLACYYRKGATGSATALTLATQTVGGAHSDGGFVEIQATNMKGVYRLDLSDTMVATAGWVTIQLYGATNMAPVTLELEIVAYDPFDTVRLGLIAIPNAAADAAGGLPISDAGGLDLDNRMPAAAAVTNLNVVYNTDFLTNYDTTFDCWVTRISDGTGTGQLDTASGTVIVGSIASGAITSTALATSAVDEIVDAVFDEATSGHTTAGTVGKLLTDVLADTAEIGAAGAGLSAIPWNAAWDTEVQSECTDALTAYAPATAAALDTIDNFLDTEIAAILADTNELQTDWANGGRLDLLLDGAASAGDPWTTSLPGSYTAGQAGYIVGTNVNATISSRASQTSLDTVDGIVDSILADTGTDGVLISNGTGTGQLQIAAGYVSTGTIAAGAIDATALASSAVAEIWTTAMTESYAADGAAPTPAQALFLIQQVLTEFSISSTTLTAKKLDGSTTAGTFTLNDATSPTSITRAS